MSSCLCNCFCLCCTANSTGVGLNPLFFAGCLFCYFSIVKSMILCLWNLFCLFKAADAAGVGLNASLFTGRFFCYFSFIKDMFMSVRFQDFCNFFLCSGKFCKNFCGYQFFLGISQLIISFSCFCNCITILKSDVCCVWQCLDYSAYCVSSSLVRIFLLVIICIVEYDDITIIEILCRNT